MFVLNGLLFLITRSQFFVFISLVFTLMIVSGVIASIAVRKNKLMQHKPSTTNKTSSEYTSTTVNGKNNKAFL